MLEQTKANLQKKIIESGYKRNIISFEPLNNCYENLVLSSSKFKNWKVEKLSLGSENKSSEINVSDYNLSSSILPISNNHLKAKKILIIFQSKLLKLKSWIRIFMKIKL